jgi:head-tail adaptor
MNWPTLNAGELRHQITILGPVAGQDESGATVTMQPFVTAYAKIEIVRGADVIRNGQVTTQTMLVISLWWQVGIASNMQVQALNGLYVIEEIENVLEMNIVLKMNCVAIGSNG